MIYMDETLEAIRQRQAYALERYNMLRAQSAALADEIRAAGEAPPNILGAYCSALEDERHAALDFEDACNDELAYRALLAA